MILLISIYILGAIVWAYVSIKTDPEFGELAAMLAVIWPLALLVYSPYLVALGIRKVFR